MVNDDVENIDYFRPIQHREEHFRQMERALFCGRVFPYSVWRAKFRSWSRGKLVRPPNSNSIPRIPQAIGRLVAFKELKTLYSAIYLIQGGIPLPAGIEKGPFSWRRILVNRTKVLAP